MTRAASLLFSDLRRRPFFFSQRYGAPGCGVVNLSRREVLFRRNDFAEESIDETFARTRFLGGAAPVDGFWRD
jgi:hypothetical protein